MKQSEHGLQVAVARMLTLCLDPDKTWWTAIDHGVGKLGKRAAGMMKARGVKRGIPDVLILVDNQDGGTRLLGIELKTEKGRLSQPQRDVAKAWENFDGALIFVARSLDEVLEILEFCRVPMIRKMFVGAR